jgi:hypothetical protein
MKAGQTWTKGGLHLGNRWKSRRDLDNHALPAGCQTLGRRREKTDRSGATHRDISFKFLLVLTRCMEGANWEISSF